MDEWVFATVVFALVITCSSFVQSAMGFGYALCSLAVLPHLIDVRLANLVVSLSILVPLAYAARANPEPMRSRLLVISLAGAAIGLPIGLLTFAFVDSQWLVRGTGLVVLLVVADGLRRALRPGAKLAPSRVWGSTYPRRPRARGSRSLAIPRGRRRERPRAGD